MEDNSGNDSPKGGDDAVRNIHPKRPDISYKSRREDRSSKASSSSRYGLTPPSRSKGPMPRSSYHNNYNMYGGGYGFDSSHGMTPGVPVDGNTSFNGNWDMNTFVPMPFSNANAYMMDSSAYQVPSRQNISQKPTDRSRRTDSGWSSYGRNSMRRSKNGDKKEEEDDDDHFEKLRKKRRRSDDFQSDDDTSKSREKYSENERRRYRNSRGNRAEKDDDSEIEWTRRDSTYVDNQKQGKERQREDKDNSDGGGNVSRRSVDDRKRNDSEEEEVNTRREQDYERHSRTKSRYRQRRGQSRSVEERQRRNSIHSRDGRGDTMLNVERSATDSERRYHRKSSGQPHQSAWGNKQTDMDTERERESDGERRSVKEHPIVPTTPPRDGPAKLNGWTPPPPLKNSNHDDAKINDRRDVGYTRRNSPPRHVDEQRQRNKDDRQRSEVLNYSNQQAKRRDEDDRHRNGRNQVQMGRARYQRDDNITDAKKEDSTDSKRRLDIRPSPPRRHEAELRQRHDDDDWSRSARDTQPSRRSDTEKNKAKKSKKRDDEPPSDAMQAAMEAAWGIPVQDISTSSSHNSKVTGQISIENEAEQSMQAPRVIRARPDEVYEQVNQVGEGTYGQVFKAKADKTGVIVALKKIRMESEKDGFPITAMREIKILQGLRHENVVRLHEMLLSKNSIYMVFEYLEHDLNGILSQSSILFTPAHLKSLAKQLLAGLAYLHHHSILHRDLKGSNLLLHRDGTLKIADFGLARRYTKRVKRNIDYTNRVVTLWYRPPELLFGETCYNDAIDVWGAGCIFLELFTRRPVFQGNDEIHQVQVLFELLGPIQKLDWPEADTLPWYDLVRPIQDKQENVVSNTDSFRQSRLYTMLASQMPIDALEVAAALLSYNPSRRISATGALQMDYFARNIPKPEKPKAILENVTGEWHELESRLARRNVPPPPGSAESLSKSTINNRQMGPPDFIASHGRGKAERQSPA